MCYNVSVTKYLFCESLLSFGRAKARPFVMRIKKDGGKMKIIEKRLKDLQPYENNPRKNDNAVPYVVESIKRYGFKNPIIIDKEGVIIAGHTRYLASMELGLEKVPCIIADDLTDEQIKEFRLVDNKTAEFSGWDFELLDLELQELNFDFDFKFPELSDIDIDELFEDHEEEEKEPKTITCPHCGKEIEI